jgi:hypothetical protein
MAAMSTVITVFADQGNARTYTVAGHTVQKPRLINQRRKVAVGNQLQQEMSSSVVYATTDASTAVIPERISFNAVVRYPITGLAGDVTAALAVFRDMVASDEFTAMVTSQNFLKP